MADDALPSLDRLRWQCRRGMLELDLLLEDFLESAYEALPDAEKRTFCRMLDYQDQLLLDWFMGRTVPADREVTRIVERIRHPVTD